MTRKTMIFQSSYVFCTDKAVVKFETTTWTENKCVLIIVSLWAIMRCAEYVSSCWHIWLYCLSTLTPYPISSSRLTKNMKIEQSVILHWKLEKESNLTKRIS